MEDRVKKLEQKIVELDQALKLMRTDVFDEMQIGEIAQKIFSDKLMEAIARTEKSSSARSSAGSSWTHVNTKDANKHLPNNFGGQHDSNFREFRHEVKTWASVLHPQAKDWLEEAEAQQHMENDSEFLKTRGDAAREVGLQLYLMLSGKCKGSPKVAVMAAQASNGYKAWNDLSRSFDPRSSTNATSALHHLQIPPKQAQSEVEFLETWKKWEHDVIEYELKYEPIKEQSKIVAVTALMTARMQEHIRTGGHEFLKYTDFKAHILRYMSSVPMKITVNDAKGRNEVNQIENDSRDQWKEQSANEEILYFNGKGGKGRNEGYEGKGWNAGWYGRRAAPYEGGWHGGWKGKGRGKDHHGKGKGEADGKGKGGSEHGFRGKAKGKGKGECWRCGGIGHQARQCASPVNLIDEGYDEYVQNSFMNTVGDEDSQQQCQRSETPPCWSLQNPEEAKAWELVTRPSSRRQGIYAMQMAKRQVSVKTKNKFDVLDGDEGDNDDANELNHIVHIDGNQAEIEVTVDSGAGDNVLPSKMFPSLPTKPTARSRGGKCFVDASGKDIANEGERTVAFITPGGNRQEVRWQAANIVQPLMSMGKLEDAGCEINVKNGMRYVKVPCTGEKIPIYKRNGTYKMRLKVNMDETGPVFSWQG